MKRKAQIQGQVFIYIITVIIAGFIFMFGYNAITSFTKQIEVSKIIDFEVELKNTFSKVGSEYQSLEKHSFVLPSDFTMVCFLSIKDFNLFELQSGEIEIKKNINQINNFPLIIDSLKSGSKNNVFIYSNWLEKSFDVGELKIINNDGAETPFYCFHLFNGKMNLEIKGLGNKAEIKEDLDFN